MEIWKDIPGYEGYYQINEAGDVRSLDRIISSGLGRSHFKAGRVLKPAIGSHGYKAVTITKDVIRYLKNRGQKVTHLAKMYSVSHATISNIVNFKTRLDG